ncbi:MAG: glycosyltransferase like 2 family protein [Acidimicrobiales bacterium]|nr:glycosyltransferase like 2 family protein [Acidimicrobiales bacterium]
MTSVVTVVVPTRNRSRRVVEAVASAQTQTLRDIEILVVDDASTDDTVATIGAVAAADPRVRILRQQVRSGAPAARNRGLDERRGEFVAFLDDDDRWLPTKLERQVACLRARPDVVLVGCHHRIVNEGDGRHLDFRGPTAFTADELLWVNTLGGASNVIVVPERIADPVRFDPDFPAYQDWDFYLRCVRFGAAALVPDVLCEYVVHEDPERLTNQLPKRLAGHELLLQRHRSEMTATCIAYHRARMRVLATTSRREKLHLLPTLLRDAPPVVLRALVMESVQGRLGRIRHDPARSMRGLRRLAASAAAAPT